MRIRWNESLHKDSAFFQLEKDVRQGDTISPKTLHLNVYSKTLIGKRKAFECHLMFVDDTVLFANSIKKLQTMLTKLNTTSKGVGLSMNFIKTKILRNNQILSTDNITVEGQQIEYIDNYSSS